MTFENLLYACSDGIATLTLNRPKALNALNQSTLKELLCLFSGIRDDAAVKVVILTGAAKKPSSPARTSPRCNRSMP